MNCHGNGQCKPNGPDGSGVCACDTDHGGSDCSTEICHLPTCVNGYCMNGGCYCQTGYTGDRCDILECPKNPNGLPCSGNGICANGTCVCEEGYVGQVCVSAELGLCPLKCSEHGTCTSTGCDCYPGKKTKKQTDIVLIVATSNCELIILTHYDSKRFALFYHSFFICTGYRGVGCDVIVCAGNCTNHGICAHGTCHCDQGWFGDDCGTPSCDQNCTAHGTCVGPNRCQCEPTWVGEDCKESICGDGCDIEFGVCNTDKSCTCNEGYGGADCSCKTHENLFALSTTPDRNATPAVCSGHGVCAGRQCFCDSNDLWGGTNCGQKMCPNEVSLQKSFFPLFFLV
jgi:hypothetical protein